MGGMYNSRWAKARLTFLARNPLCVFCQKEGRLRQATVVDHVIPHKGDRTLFWDSDNWQSLCQMHHSGSKQRMEARRITYSLEVGADGFPVDPMHPSNMLTNGKASGSVKAFEEDDQ